MQRFVQFLCEYKLELYIFLKEGVTGLPTMPTKWIFSTNSADQEDFVPTKRILCRQSGFCADQVDFAPTK